MTRLKAPTELKAPVAEKIQNIQFNHGDSLADDYFWLKDQGYPEVTDKNILSYLDEENDYFNAIMGDKKALTNTLFNELKGRIKEDDQGVPFFDGAYEYFWAFAKGAQYRTWYRRHRHEQTDFSIYFDEVSEAGDLDFFKLHDLAVSPDGKLLAWSTDTNGSERFTIRVKNIETGEVFADEITETSGEIVWASDSRGFCYTLVSKEWRPYCAKYHALGADGDQTLYEEKDTSFFVHIGETSSKKWMVIRSADHVTAENHMVALDDPLSEPKLIASRTVGHDYSVDHGWDDQFFIRSNRNHSNFDILSRPVNGDPGAAWTLVMQGSRSRYIRGIQLFSDFMAIQERIDGLDQITIKNRDGDCHSVEFPEDVCECGLGANCDYETSVVRLTYTSMITPNSIFDYDVRGMRLMLMKEQEIPSGYDKSNYATTRMMVTARDGAQVPVSIVHSNNWQKGAGAPLHLYGYGAYGLGMSPSFSSARLSLLDRGFAYAIAHIRGGDEMGYDWYKAGKLDQRTNTFNDFVDCARALVDADYAASGGISISGGSAGGELMGAVVNQAPELFAGCVMHVPFVDVLNTMLDDSLPLTPIEWPEWGNPIESADDYATIKSYCPYTNMAAKDYPPQLVTGGLNDPRVTYWEPAKWTAKMRATKTDDNLLCMKINMDAGHAGKSGRFERLQEVAEEYTFLLMCFGQD